MNEAQDDVDRLNSLMNEMGMNARYVIVPGGWIQRQCGDAQTSWRHRQLKRHLELYEDRLVKCRTIWANPPKETEAPASAVSSSEQPAP